MGDFLYVLMPYFSSRGLCFESVCAGIGSVQSFFRHQTGKDHLSYVYRKTSVEAVGLGKISEEVLFGRMIDDFSAERFQQSQDDFQ